MAPASLTPNGVDGEDSESKGIALTEYSTTPSLFETPKASSLVPSDFLAPDGHPDVCFKDFLSVGLGI